jgi:hypothetical protein
MQGSKRGWGVLGIGSLLAVGCATGGAQTAGPLSPGDSQGKPSVEALPSLDVAESSLTREMRMARMLSEESLNLPAPPAPVGRGAQEVQLWGEQSLAPWLELKQSRAEAARAELDKAAQQSHRQRVMAGALVGLVFEDVASVLLSVPAPAELESEPEVLRMYRELVQVQAAPYLRHAKLGYDACAANAQAIASMAHWSTFCGERSGRLAVVEPSGALGEGQTSVSVTRE